MGSQGAGHGLNGDPDFFAFALEPVLERTVGFVVQQRLLAVLANTDGIQGWVTSDRITVQIEYGVQVLEAGAVRLPEVTSIQDDFDFIVFGESFGSSSGEFAADFCWGEIGTLVFVVNQSAQALFAVRAGAGLWGGFGNLGDAGGATAEDAGDGGLEAGEQTFVFEEV